MTSYSKAKGNRGHQLTKEYLEKKGWSVWVKPHQETTWRGAGNEWRRTGSNDIFAIPKTGSDSHKKQGGFDILAIKDMYSVNVYFTYYQGIDKNSEEINHTICTFWQVKKTKRNPITPTLKKEIQECADYHKIPRSSCYIIWWPDGVGLKHGKPLIWRADNES